MNNLFLVLNILFVLACNNPPSSHPKEEKTTQKVSKTLTDSIPSKVGLLLRAYKNIVSFDGKYIVFPSGKKIIFDDSTKKNTEALLNSPDIEDMFCWAYNTEADKPTEDPGRVRNEDFFKAVYGETSTEVRTHLMALKWCPNTVNQTIMFSTKNGAYEALQKVSAELDKHPEWSKYLTNIGGTFNWRVIKGTDRLSAHAFGITIDINTAYSNYWQWDCDCTNENANLDYKNRIPMGIVDIFEKNGFIWGGRWRHYDTMHFEYRPELLTK
ncbi:MAG: hypothetical protein RL365_1843 [Bacteroidota bacterium]